MIKGRLMRFGTGALACAVIAGGVFAAGMPAKAAQVTDTGSTSVIYDTRNVIEGDDALYAMVIPKTINFTSGKTQATINVEIIGYGNELTDFTDLQVKASVASAEGYHLRGIEGHATGDTTPEYKVVFGDQTLNSETGKDNTEITAGTLGQGRNTVTKLGVDNNATLTKEAKKSGKYKDTLTFTFNELKNSITGEGV